jgi:hypothetical protein
MYSVAVVSCSTRSEGPFGKRCGGKGKGSLHAASGSCSGRFAEEYCETVVEAATHHSMALNIPQWLSLTICCCLQHSQKLANRLLLGAKAYTVVGNAWLGYKCLWAVP